jgi:hypothetical protein
MPEGNKRVHIVVQDGLIQEVYLENLFGASVVIYDLDTDMPEERVDTEKLISTLRTSNQAYKIY